MSYKRNYYNNHLCLNCRVSFKNTHKCPHCNSSLNNLRADFHLPKKNDLKSWKKLKQYLEDKDTYEQIHTLAHKVDKDNYPYKMNTTIAIMGILNTPTRINLHDFRFCIENHLILTLNPQLSKSSYLKLLKRYTTYGMIHESFYTSRRFSQYP